jgi:hypothetical protein
MSASIKINNKKKFSSVNPDGQMLKEVLKIGL